MEFSGKTIWITGATSGIGRAVAAEISHCKSTLILSGRDEKALEEVGKICTENGSRIVLAPFDLGDEQSVKHAAENVLKQMTKIDCLYHFGGISQRSLVSETPTEIDRKILEVNFFGTVSLTKAILPLMINNGEGHIAVTTSIVGTFGFPYRSAYSASKHALQGYFESLRTENTQNNIKVSIIIPGRIKTNISANALDKNGQRREVRDISLENGKDVNESAKYIIRKLKKQKKEILVGGKEIIMVYIRKMIPALYYYLSTRVKPM